MKNKQGYEITDLTKDDNHLQERYTKETGDSSIRFEADNGIISFSEEYVLWLEELVFKQ